LHFSKIYSLLYVLIGSSIENNVLDSQKIVYKLSKLELNCQGFLNLLVIPIKHEIFKMGLKFSFFLIYSFFNFQLKFLLRNFMIHESVFNPQTPTVANMCHLRQYLLKSSNYFRILENKKTSGQN